MTTPRGRTALAAQAEALGHVVPFRCLLGVLGTLLLLTWVTVGATHLDLGVWNLWLALGIAALKSSLVALYFMHLRWDSRLNAIFFVGAVLFVVLFLGLALMDSVHYRPERLPGYVPGLPQMAEARA